MMQTSNGINSYVDNNNITNDDDSSVTTMGSYNDDDSSIDLLAPSPPPKKEKEQERQQGHATITTITETRENQHQSPPQPHPFTMTTTTATTTRNEEDYCNDNNNDATKDTHNMNAPQKSLPPKKRPTSSTSFVCPKNPVEEAVVPSSSLWSSPFKSLDTPKQEKSTAILSSTNLTTPCTTKTVGQPIPTAISTMTPVSTAATGSRHTLLSGTTSLTSSSAATTVTSKNVQQQEQEYPKVGMTPNENKNNTPLFCSPATQTLNILSQRDVNENGDEDLRYDMSQLEQIHNVTTNPTTTTTSSSSPILQKKDNHPEHTATNDNNMKDTQEGMHINSNKTSKRERHQDKKDTNINNTKTRHVRSNTSKDMAVGTKSTQAVPSTRSKSSSTKQKKITQKENNHGKNNWIPPKTQRKKREKRRKEKQPDDANSPNSTKNYTIPKKSQYSFSYIQSLIGKNNQLVTMNDIDAIDSDNNKDCDGSKKYSSALPLHVVIATAQYELCHAKAHDVKKIAQVQMGQVGIQCKHCLGYPPRRGGKFFCSDMEHFSSNRYSTFLLTHISTKCNQCPLRTRKAVIQMQQQYELNKQNHNNHDQEEEEEAPKSQGRHAVNPVREFLHRVWNHLHHDSDENDSDNCSNDDNQEECCSITQDDGGFESNIFTQTSLSAPPMSQQNNDNDSDNDSRITTRRQSHTDSPSHPDSTTTTTSNIFSIDNLVGDNPLINLKEDKGTVPDLWLVLTAQLEPKPIKEHEQGFHDSRSLILQCKYCKGKAKAKRGAYGNFMLSRAKILSPTCFHVGTQKHLIHRCHVCPESIRNTLVQMKGMEFKKKNCKATKNSKNATIEFWERVLKRGLTLSDSSPQKTKIPSSLSDVEDHNTSVSRMDKNQDSFPVPLVTRGKQTSWSSKNDRCTDPLNAGKVNSEVHVPFVRQNIEFTQPGTLGMVVSRGPVTSDGQNTCFVRKVLKGSQADKAQLLPGDVLGRISLSTDNKEYLPYDEVKTWPTCPRPITFSIFRLEKREKKSFMGNMSNGDETPEASCEHASSPLKELLYFSQKEVMCSTNSLEKQKGETDNEIRDNSANASKKIIPTPHTERNPNTETTTTSCKNSSLPLKELMRSTNSIEKQKGKTDNETRDNTANAPKKKSPIPHTEMNANNETTKVQESSLEVPFCRACKDKTHNSLYHHALCPKNPHFDNSGAEEVLDSLRRGVQNKCPACTYHYQNGRKPKHLAHCKKCDRNKEAISSKNETTYKKSTKGTPTTLPTQLKQKGQPQNKTKNRFSKKKNLAAGKNTKELQQGSRKRTNSQRINFGKASKNKKAKGCTSDILPISEDNIANLASYEAGNTISPALQPSKSTYGDQDSNGNNDTQPAKPNWVSCPNPWGPMNHNDRDVVLFSPCGGFTHHESICSLERFTSEPFCMKSDYYRTHTSPEEGYHVLKLTRDRMSLRPWGFSIRRHDFGGACLVQTVDPMSPAEAAKHIGSPERQRSSSGQRASGLNINDMIICINGTEVGGMTEVGLSVELETCGSELLAIVSRYKNSSGLGTVGSQVLLDHDEKDQKSLVEWAEIGAGKIFDSSDTHKIQPLPETSVHLAVKLDGEDHELSKEDSFIHLETLEQDSDHDNDNKNTDQESPKHKPSDYELLRLRNIERNNTRLKELGLLKDKPEKWGTKRTAIQSSTLVSTEQTKPTEIRSKRSNNSSSINEVREHCTDGSSTDKASQSSIDESSSKGFAQKITEEDFNSTEETLNSNDSDGWEDDEEPWLGCICGTIHPKPVKVFWVQCDDCEAWYNVSSKCVGFSEKEAESLSTWNCLACSGSDTNIFHSSVFSQKCGAVSEDEASESSACNIGTFQKVRDVYALGTVVKVSARTGPNENKLGGVGRVSAVHNLHNGETSYDIKYILGGNERNVDPDSFEVHNFGANSLSGRHSIGTRSSRSS